VAGTPYYVIKKPTKDAALLFLNVPYCIGVSGRGLYVIVIVTHGAVIAYIIL
jgi:hypothetical protein